MLKSLFRRRGRGEREPSAPTAPSAPSREPESKTISIAGTDATIFGYPDDSYFADVGSHVAHNWMLLRTLGELGPGSVVIDGGANIGATAICMFRFAHAPARIIAVEPSHQALRCLERTIEANGLSGKIEIVRTALSDRAGSQPFNESDFLPGSHLVSDGDKAAVSGEVSVTTLDALARTLGLARLDLVKLDIEGHELDALNGATAVIRKFNPIFVAEFNSFAICTSRRVSPVLLLERILELFGSFTYLHDDEPRTVATRQQGLDFIFRNMKVSVVDDIRFGGPRPRST